MSGAVATRPGSQTGRRSQVESFFRTLILGDFEDHPNTAGEIIGGLISLIPVLDQVMDARDIAACLYRINHQGGFKNATPDQIVNLGFAGIGAIPEIGSVFKTVFRPLWRERHLAKSAVHGGTQAIEAMLGMKKGGAIDWIRKELLGKWGPRTQQAIAQVNLAMDSCIQLLEFIANASGWKGSLIPDGIQAMAGAALPGMMDMRAGVNATMQQATAEIGMFLQDLLGEQAAKVVMEAGKRAIAASAVPGSRSNSHNRHNAAAAKPQGKELPRQPREKTGSRDKANTAKGAGGTHAASQLTRQAFGKMAHVATGLIGEHMVDYFELNRLGGTFMHDSNKRFPKGAGVAKINADKRPVNLGLEDLPKVPHKGIDAVWKHGEKYTVTEAKARGSIFAVEGMLGKMKVPEGLKSHDDKLLYFLLSTSKSDEGDGKTLVQMSSKWVQSRAGGESLEGPAELALKGDMCDRRVVLVTFESSGAVDHAQALAEINLGCEPTLASVHEVHGIHTAWNKQAIDRVSFTKAAVKDAKKPNESRPDKPSKGQKSRKG